MPVLRRPHDHHRDLRARLPAKASPHTCADHPDRHLMRPSPPIDNCSAPCHSRRLSAASAHARVGLPESSALPPRTWSCSVRPTRLLLHAPGKSDSVDRRAPISSSLAPRPNPHSVRCTAATHLPRFRALALLGRRPPQRVDDIVIPASEKPAQQATSALAGIKARLALPSDLSYTVLWVGLPAMVQERP